MTDKIVLLENLDDVNRLENEIKNDDSKKICFDFKSYNALNKIGIKCCVVEDYFDENDQLLIDNLAIEFTTTWYKNKEISEFLKFEGINVGYLLELELLPYFFGQLRRFVGVLNILQKENPMTVSASSLTSFIPKSYVGKMQHTSHHRNKSVSLYYDTIEIPIKIRNNIFTLRLSRKNYQRIKRLTDSITNKFLVKKFDFRNSNNKKNILLLEFNPENYESMLKSLSYTKHNLILLNQRRPVITNLISRRIVKEFGCTIHDLKESNDGIRDLIKKEQESFERNLSLLWNRNVFQEIFSVRNHSFWNSIKDDFVVIIRRRCHELVRNILLTKSLLDNVHIDLIIDWANTATEEKIISLLANRKKIPVITLQHGAYPTNEKFVKYLPFQPIIPIQENKIVVWGNIMKDYVLRHCVIQKNIESIGSPKHDKYFIANQSNDGNSVLIVVTEIYHSNFEGTNTKTFQQLDEFVRCTYQTIKKITNKKIIVKLRSGQSSYDVQPVISEIDPHATIYKTQDIFDVIRMCDTIISLNFSTVILESMILKKPTMTILPEKQGYEDDIIMKSGATLVVNNLNELEIRLRDILFDEVLRNRLVENGRRIIDEYFVNQGKASYEFAKFVDSLV